MGASPIERVLLTLGGSTRLEILQALAREPQSVSVLADTLELDVSSISHNLQRLRDSGLVTATVNRRHHVYQLSTMVTSRVSRGQIVLVIRVTKEFQVHIGYRAGH